MESSGRIRADARENRDLLLEIARKALDRDQNASLNSIAKEAGVGPGTLYRHFPNRESLILAVYQKELDDLAQYASSLMNKYEPIKALRVWCDKLVKSSRMKYSAANILNAAKADPKFNEIYQPLLAAIQALLHAGEKAKQVHAGTKAEDFLMLLGFLWTAPQDSLSEAQIKRLIDAVFRGIAY